MVIESKITSKSIHYSKLPYHKVSWCSISLNEVVAMGKRLEAAVYSIEAREAQAVVDACSYPKSKLLGDSFSFVKNAHYGGRMKRNYVSPASVNAVGFIGSSEMLAVYPTPTNFMNSTNDEINQLRVELGTVLLSRSGTIGNLTLVNKSLAKLLVSEHAIRLECGNNAGYVYCYLKSKVAQAIIKSKIFGAVIQEIEPEHLADIPVPIPPDNIKEKINTLIIRSFDLRDESNELIDKATDMLINTLKLPPIDKFESTQTDNETNINIYNIKLSELNGRLDASYHQPVVKAIIKHLHTHAAEVTTIGDARVSRGIILPGRFKRIYVEDGQGRVFIGGKQLFELDPSNKKYLSITHHKERIKQQLELEENMTLITCSGTIGKVTLVPRHWNKWAASQHIIRVVPADSNVAGYISIFLASDYGKQLITRYIYGSIVDEIDDNHVSQIPFPLLKNPETQSKINRLALQANELRYKAYQLEQEAINILENEVIQAK